MNKIISDQQNYSFLSEKNRFERLSEDPVKLQERQLERYLR